MLIHTYKDLRNRCRVEFGNLIINDLVTHILPSDKVSKSFGDGISSNGTRDRTQDQYHCYCVSQSAGMW